jgi:Cu/Ag efflux protein CusF
MIRSIVTAFIGFGIFSVGLPAQDDIQRGTIKKVDVDKGIVTITVSGKDHAFVVTDSTQIMDVAGKPARDRLRHPDFKEGAPVMFKTGSRDGKVILVGLKLAGPKQPAQQDALRGRIKRVNSDKGTITITADGKDHELTVADDTPVMDTAGKPAAGRLKHPGFKEGAPVIFRAGMKDGRMILVGLKLVGANQQSPEPVDLSRLIPLTDMGDKKYQGSPGGLYPGGQNLRPAGHQAAGLELAKQVQPLDADGKPSADGKIVLLSVGMSNTNQAFGGLMRVAREDKDINPKVVLVNGAQGGMTAALIQNENVDRQFPTGQRVSYWPQVDNLLAKAGVTRAQVQAVWIKQADAGPNEGFPKYAQKLQGELANIVRLLHKRFPNLKLVYLSSRTYGGFAKTRLNPEPYAYESGFSVKWLIEQQISGEPALNFDPGKAEVKAPWLSWGPYLWARGTDKRSDGFSYEETDFTSSDGTHESQAGGLKVGNQLLQFFKTDSTTKGWFVKQSN